MGGVGSNPSELERFRSKPTEPSPSLHRSAVPHSDAEARIEMGKSGNDAFQLRSDFQSDCSGKLLLREYVVSPLKTGLAPTVYDNCTRRHQRPGKKRRQTGEQAWDCHAWFFPLGVSWKQEEIERERERESFVSDGVDVVLWQRSCENAGMYYLSCF